MTAKLLWTNSAPTAAFAAQTIAVSTEYDWYVIVAQYHTSTPSNLYTSIIKCVDWSDLVCTQYGDVYSDNKVGRWYLKTTGGISVSGARPITTDTDVERYAIPVKIYGIKGKISLS